MLDRAWIDSRLERCRCPQADFGSLAVVGPEDQLDTFVTQLLEQPVFVAAIGQFEGDDVAFLAFPDVHLHGASPLGLTEKHITSQGKGGSQSGDSDSCGDGIFPRFPGCMEAGWALLDGPVSFHAMRHDFIDVEGMASITIRNLVYELKTRLRGVACQPWTGLWIRSG